MKVHRNRVLLSPLCFALALASGATAAPAVGPAGPSVAIMGIQDDEEEEPKPDKRPEIKEELDQLKEYISDRKGERDHDAIALIDTLLNKEFEQSGPKDRKDIVKALSSCLKVKRQTDSDGVPDNKLYVAAAVALGGMGPESAKELQSWIDHKSHRRDLALQRELILSLGKVKDEDSIEFLTDLLTHKDPEVLSAAAEALGNYSERPEKDRKEIFEEVLKVLGAAKTNVDADVNDTIARERYDIIEAAMITTLQIMSGEDLRDPAEWQHWWNKNKRESWDEKS